MRHLPARTRHRRKIILYAAAGKKRFYARLGFQRMTTAMAMAMAMAIFQDEDGAMQRGLIERHAPPG